MGEAELGTRISRSSGYCGFMFFSRYWLYKLKPCDPVPPVIHDMEAG